MESHARAAHDAVARRRLLRAAQRGDPRSRELLVQAHLGLVRSVASHYRELGLPLDDLIQEGSLGLLDAIDRYDPCHGATFETYARFRVRRAIRNALTDQARLIRLPKQVVERRRAISRAEARLATEASGRAPTPAQLAVDTGLSVAAVVDARAAGLRTDLTRPARPSRRLLAGKCRGRPRGRRSGARRDRARAGRVAAGCAREIARAASADRQPPLGHRQRADVHDPACRGARAVATPRAGDRTRCPLRAQDGPGTHERAPMTSGEIAAAVRTSPHANPL